jgi:hypothetical protein
MLTRMDDLDPALRRNIELPESDTRGEDDGDAAAGVGWLGPSGGFGPDGPIAHPPPTAGSDPPDAAPASATDAPHEAEAEAAADDDVASPGEDGILEGPGDIFDSASGWSDRDEAAADEPPADFTDESLPG